MAGEKVTDWGMIALGALAIWYFFLRKKEEPPPDGEPPPGVVVTVGEVAWA